MSLKKYFDKRDFNKTNEPKGQVHTSQGQLYIIQKHAAKRLHYDLRIELEGVLKSWAIPKGPSFNPKVKRLAIHVEDHPVEYGSFEGTIPTGEYGAGAVMLWDEGYWETLDNDPLEAYQKGHLRFNLHGRKLKGRWDLFQFNQQENGWFLVKYKDEFANSKKKIVETQPNSIFSGKSLEEIKAASGPQWTRAENLKKNNKFKPTKLKQKEESMPKTCTPELATLVDKPPTGEDWLHELKYDGYRILAFKKNQEVTLFSRNKKNWTKQFKEIAEKVQQLPIENIILDGEIVVLDKKGRSRFQLLQNAIKAKEKTPLVYYVFDLLYYDKWNVCNLPLLERKALLEPILLHADSFSLRYSDHLIGQGSAFYQRACEFGLEGIISKRLDARYVSQRTKSWLKIKCNYRQEFVIGGFSKPKGSRSYFGSLLLGYYNEKGELLYSGKVGTGFTHDSLQKIFSQLKPLVTQQHPFKHSPPDSKHATWVEPKLIAEVEFSEWTNDMHLRHPSFKGMREDKKAQEVTLEKEKPIAKMKKKNEDKQLTSTVKLSNPNKILYPEDGITKKQIFDYYEEICSWILPFIKNRPLTLVRCPDNYNECFFQKHINASSSKALRTIPITSPNTKKIEDYHYLNNEAGLLGLVQMGVLEIHPWGCTIERLAQPDIIIIDIDPSPEVAWSRVVQAAFDIRNYLKGLKLESLVKTTGGKGLHVVVPIQPQHDWQVIKQFTKLFVEFVKEQHPDSYVTTMSKAKRKGKIFLDYLRNQYNATAIAPYSLRAKLHAPAAAPLAWDELTNDIQDTFFTIKTLPKRLAHLKEDPWKNFYNIGKQILTID